VVEAMVNSRREEGEALEEALDVRVLALRGLELKPRRDLRVPRGELRTEAPEVGELPLVVEQQVVAHVALAQPLAAASVSCTSYSPLAISSTVSKTTSSRPGSITSTASTTNRTCGARTCCASRSLTRGRASRGAEGPSAARSAERGRARP